MRIVLSNASHSWGGVHFVTKLLAVQLQQRGHDVLLLCRPNSRLEASIRAVAPVEPVLTGMDLHPRTTARVYRTLRRFAPDVVLVMTKKDVRLTAPSARILGIPVVVRHANDRGLRRGLYHRALYGWLPAHHVANSHATRRTLISSAPWLEQMPVSVIYNGVDAAAFEVAPADLDVPPDAVKFAFIGRIEYRKGIFDLAAAWPQVAAALPTSRLIIVGTGPDEGELRAALAEREDVHWLGHRNDIPAVLNAVDVVVMPSYWEGFGLVAAEAMAAARPVVATNASSLPEIVRDGTDGILVPVGAPDELATGMLRLGRDGELRVRMGEAGAHRVRTDFSYERMVDAYEELLTLVAGSGARTRSSTRRPKKRSSR